jgi:hypothetical protein
MSSMEPRCLACGRDAFRCPAVARAGGCLGWCHQRLLRGVSGRTFSIRGLAIAATADDRSVQAHFRKAANLDSESGPRVWLPASAIWCRARVVPISNVARSSDSWNDSVNRLRSGYTETGSG